MLTVNNVSDIIQETGIRTAKVGETVTLRCSCKQEGVTNLLWYQQNLGSKPHIISKRIKHSTEAEISPAYKKRFQIVAKSKSNINDLIIKDLQRSDSGMYYCVFLENTFIEFGQGVFLHVKQSPSNTKLPIHPPKRTILQLGESLNLTCRVYAEHSAAERNLYWFRHAGLKPELMIPSDKHCINASNGKFHGKCCTSKLRLNSVMPVDAGTYRCALASYGVVFLGEGTEVEVVGMWPPQFLNHFSGNEISHMDFIKP